MWSGYSLLCTLLAAVAVASAQEDLNGDLGNAIDLRSLLLYVTLVLLLSAGVGLEGDILLTPEQETTLEAFSNPSDPFGPQNAVVLRERSLWPNGKIYYVLDSSLISKNQLLLITLCCPDTSYCCLFEQEML